MHSFVFYSKRTLLWAQLVGNYCIYGKNKSNPYFRIYRQIFPFSYSMIFCTFK